MAAKKQAYRKLVRKSDGSVGNSFVDVETGLPILLTDIGDYEVQTAGNTQELNLGQTKSSDELEPHILPKADEPYQETPGYTGQAPKDYPNVDLKAIQDFSLKGLGAKILASPTAQKFFSSPLGQKIIQAIVPPAAPAKPQTAAQVNKGAATFMNKYFGLTVPTTAAVTKGATTSTTGTAAGKFNSVGNHAARGVDKIDAKLTEILTVAADRMPGFHVEARSGFRPGDDGQHGKGKATDIVLVDDATGKPVPNYQNASSFAVYEKYAQITRQVQQELHPDLNDSFRWGGYFSGPKGKYGAMDLMHFDTGGRKGLGMAGGSWDKGLTDKQKSLWPGAQSLGKMAIADLAVPAPAVAPPVPTSVKTITTPATVAAPTKAPEVAAVQGMKDITRPSSPAQAAALGYVARTPEEKAMIAFTLAGELGPNTLAGMAKGDINSLTEFANMVTAIENRAGSGKFGDNLSDALVPSQFNSLMDDQLDVTASNFSQYQQSIMGLLDSYYTADGVKPSDYTYTHYFNPTIANPDWGSKLSGIKEVGDHRFGVLDSKWDVPNPFEGSLPQHQVQSENVSSRPDSGGMFSASKGAGPTQAQAGLNSTHNQSNQQVESSFHGTSAGSLGGSASGFGSGLGAAGSGPTSSFSPSNGLGSVPSAPPTFDYDKDGPQ